MRAVRGRPLYVFFQAEDGIRDIGVTGVQTCALPISCCTPNVLAYSGIALNEVIKGLAKPLVICKLTPSNIENIKKIAIFFCRNNVNALSPKASTKLVDLASLFVSQ